MFDDDIFKRELDIFDNRFSFLSLQSSDHRGI